MLQYSALRAEVLPGSAGDRPYRSLVLRVRAFHAAGNELVGRVRPAAISATTTKPNAEALLQIGILTFALSISLALSGGITCASPLPPIAP